MDNKYNVNIQKTHTIFGYSKENVPGMYQLFARHVLNDTRIKDKKDIFIEIRFTELYQSKIRDLLSEDKAECFVRENSEGVINLRAQPKVCEDNKIRAYPITGVRVQTEEELLAVIADGVSSRNVGNSTLHDKSSRSHAFLEFELVSTELIEERNKMVEKEADILKLQIMIDSIKSRMYDKDLVDEKYLPWIEGLGIRDIEGLRKEMAEHNKDLKHIQENLKRLTNDNRKDRGFIGGTMVFVDLAGNEYGRDVKNKDQQEERERNEINKSLLALKECIRALHNNKDYVGYRGSKLTMYLRTYLNGQDAKAIMIANIGSSQMYSKQSINTLHYSSLVAKA